MKRLAGFSALVLLVSLSEPAFPYPGLFPGLEYPTGEAPTSIALGDLDRDGMLDVVTANFLSADISVLRGVPGGSLADEDRYPVGERPDLNCCETSCCLVRSVALGDINQDGLLDAVTANPESDDVSVLLALGAAGFAPYEKYAVGDGPSSIALGDLNGDGLLDIVTASAGNGYAGPGAASVLFARAGGGFAPQETHPLGYVPGGVALGDVNGDGLLDIVTVNRNEGWGEGPGNASVLLSRGGGEFEEQKTYLVAQEPSGVALGDLNRDGLLDIVSAGGSGVSVLLQLTDGGFGDAESYAGGTSVALGDMNGDGLLDIVTAGLYGEEASVLLAKPGGGFEDHGRYPVGKERCWGSSSVALGDLNGDGRLDIVTPNGGSDDVSVFLTHPGVKIVSQDRYPVGTGPLAMALGDLTGDGLIDVATANIHSGDVSVLAAAHGGGFGPEKRYDVPERPWDIALGDLNGDGLLDMVTLGDGRLTLFYGLEGGELQAPQTLDGLWMEPLCRGDLSGDRLLDIVMAGCGNGLCVLPGRAGGGFDEMESYPTGATQRISCMALGDLNGDGFPDIVTGHASWGEEGAPGAASILLSRDGGFAEPEVHELGGGPTDVALGDLNGDGRPDVAATIRATGVVSLLVARPEGGFVKGGDLDAGPYPASLALGDVNADGLLDIVTANHETNDVSMLLSTGDGGFAREERYSAGHAPISVALADLNGDGLLDVVTANYGYADTVNDISVLYNLGAHGKFIRGDSNADGSVDLSDAVTILRYLFLGEGEITCIDSADVNDNGEVGGDGVTDAIHLLAYLFLGGAAPPEPLGDCGFDRTLDVLTCDGHAACAAGD